MQGGLAIQGAQVGPGPLAKQYLAMARQVKSLIDPTAAPRRQLRPLAAIARAQGELRSAGRHRLARRPDDDRPELRDDDQGPGADRGPGDRPGCEHPDSGPWFKKKEQQALLGGLRGKAIPVKITGNLSQPKLDTKAYQDFGKQFASAAVQGFLDKNQQKVQGLIDKEAGKLLEGFFGPKPKASGSVPPAVVPMP